MFVRAYVCVWRGRTGCGRPSGFCRRRTSEHIRHGPHPPALAPVLTACVCVCVSSVRRYGQWPASGEIDIMESRGNKPGYPKGQSVARQARRAVGSPFPKQACDWQSSHVDSEVLTEWSCAVLCVGGCAPGGYDSFGSCMHWGPFFGMDEYPLTCKGMTLDKGTFVSRPVRLQSCHVTSPPHPIEAALGRDE